MRDKGDGRRVTLFVIALWLLLAWPAYALRGTLGLEGLSFAAMLCLLPGLALFVVFPTRKTPAASNGQQAVTMLAGMTARMLFVLIGVLGLQQVRPDLKVWEFLVWLVVFYFSTLAYETVVLIKRQQSGTVSQSQESGE